MKKILFAIVFSGSILSSTQTLATNPGGSDSCGLGWAITQKKTLSATTTRGTTNAIVPPTFGMTSGTLGCDAHTIAKKDLPAARYAFTNFDTLKHEMAIGAGETLTGLSQIMGCSNTQNFSRVTKEKYTQIFSNSQTTPIEMFKNVQKITQSECYIL